MKWYLEENNVQVWMKDGDLDLLKYNMVDSVSCSCCQSAVCKEDEAITSETGGFASRVRNPYLPAAQWGQIDPTGLGLWSMSCILCLSSSAKTAPAACTIRSPLSGISG